MNHKEKMFQKFLLLWVGDLISSIGGGLTAFGIGVYVYQKTGMASHVAMVTLLSFLPTLLLSAPAGVLADRYDRRLIMILGDGLSALGPLFILFCLLNNDVQLWQIYVGVTISSIFFSLLEPAYRATITDMLTGDQYTKASGLAQAAGSAKYLISPVIAGFLLKYFDISLLLTIDICTFFVTLATTLVVRRGLESKKKTENTAFLSDFKEGFRALSKNKGVMTLVFMGTFITLCLGYIQTLASPMILSFSNSTTLGVVQALMATGMLVSSVLLGVVPIKRGYVKVLCFSLFGSGVFMVLFGMKENLTFITLAGILFFSMLPFANTSIDYLLRTNINNELQGRVWGLVGLISQLGYIFAYATSGVLADYVFTPLLLEGGGLSGSVGKILGTGQGRGAGFLILIAGGILCIVSMALYRMKSVQTLESGGDLCLDGSSEMTS
jgi:MFS family permease